MENIPFQLLQGAGSSVDYYYYYIIDMNTRESWNEAAGQIDSTRMLKELVCLWTLIKFPAVRIESQDLSRQVPLIGRS